MLKPKNDRPDGFYERSPIPKGDIFPSFKEELAEACRDLLDDDDMELMKGSVFD